MYKPDDRAKAWLDEITARANPRDVIPDHAIDAADKRVSAAKRFTQDVRNATPENKVNGGIWLVGAALSLLGTYSAAKNSLTKDEQGERHFQWSQVGVALIQAGLAAGCASMGVQSLRAGRA
jgi:hypothetical protein